jgi:hypothetical protein
MSTPDLRTLLFYAQKGARERLADAAALRRNGFPPPEWLARAAADAEAIAEACAETAVPIDPAFARALQRARGA